jgi:hypothetical protein
LNAIHHIDLTKNNTSPIISLQAVMCLSQLLEFDGAEARLRIVAAGACEAITDFMEIETDNVPADLSLNATLEVNGYTLERLSYTCFTTYYTRMNCATIHTVPL